MLDRVTSRVAQPEDMRVAPFPPLLRIRAQAHPLPSAPPSCPLSPRKWKLAGTSLSLLPPPPCSCPLGTYMTSPLPMHSVRTTCTNFPLSHNDYCHSFRLDRSCLHPVSSMSSSLFPPSSFRNVLSHLFRPCPMVSCILPQSHAGQTFLCLVLGVRLHIWKLGDASPLVLTSRKMDEKGCHSLC